MTSSTTPPTPPEDRKDQEAILSTILLFFTGLRNASPSTMLSTVLPTGHAALLRPSPPNPSSNLHTKQIFHLTLADVIAKVTTISDGVPRLEENIALASWQDGDDGDRYGGRRTEVRVAGGLGMAWTPFEVRTIEGGEVVNVGTNVFTLLKRVEGERVGEWAICGIADTGPMK